MHKQILCRLFKDVYIDVNIAQEIKLLNLLGLQTEASCQGDKDNLPTALIKPGMVDVATALGFKPIYKKDIGLYEITLNSNYDHEVIMDADGEVYGIYYYKDGYKETIEKEYREIMGWDKNKQGERT